MSSKITRKVIKQLQRGRDRGVLSFDTALLRQGGKFTSSFRWENGVADDGRVGMFIENTTTDTDYIIVVQERVGVTADVTISRQATENTAGTELPVTNAWERNGLFDDTVRVTGGGEGGDYDHNSPTILEDLIAGGGSGGGRTAQPVGPQTFSIEPGSNALITLTNRSGQEVDRVSLAAVIYEVTPERLLSSRRPTDFSDTAADDP